MSLSNSLSPKRVEFATYRSTNNGETGEVKIFSPKSEGRISSKGEIEFYLDILTKDDTSKYLIVGSDYIIIIDDIYSEKDTARYIRFLKFGIDIDIDEFDFNKKGIAFKRLFKNFKHRKELHEDEKKLIKIDFNVNLSESELSHYRIESDKVLM